MEAYPKLVREKNGIEAIKNILKEKFFTNIYSFSDTLCMRSEFNIHIVDKTDREIECDNF